MRKEGQKDSGDASVKNSSFHISVDLTIQNEDTEEVENEGNRARRVVQDEESEKGEQVQKEVPKLSLSVFQKRGFESTVYGCLIKYFIILFINKKMGFEDEITEKETIKIMKKSKRSQEEIQRLKKYIDKQPYFKNLKKLNKAEYDVITLSCAQQFRLEFYKKEELIIRIGDIGRTFYIIIDG